MNAGLHLRQAREQRHLTLREVSNVTKVPVGALEAIERNDIGRLPGGIFTRGFVRAYAAAVGVDPATAVDDFLEQFEDSAEAESNEEHADSVDTSGPVNRIPMFGSLGLGAVLLVYSAYVAATGTSAESSPAALLPDAPAIVSSAEDVRLPPDAPPTSIVSSSPQFRTAVTRVQPERAAAAELPPAPPEPEPARDVTDAPAAVPDQEPPANAPAPLAPTEPTSNPPDPGSD